MAENLLPTARTTVTCELYVAACLRAWKALTGVWPSRESIGVLWAHYALETGGGAHCYNFNIGNVKHVAGDGHDYCALKGVWESCTAETFAALLHPPLGHLIRLDPSPDHAKAVGPGHLAVIFDPPHPASWFRSYPTLNASMLEHMRMLKERRYATAWPAVEAGNVALFAQKLRERGYFTASLSAYAAGMQGWFDRFVKSEIYAWSMEEIAREEGDVTIPEAVSGSGGIIHPLSYRAEDPPLDIAPVEVHEIECGSWMGDPCNCKVAYA